MASFDHSKHAASFVCKILYLLVIVYRSMNGILEMDGFQHTFRRLYQPDSMFDPELMSQSAGSSPHFDSKNMPGNYTDNNHTESHCSSGNGPSSDTLIVRIPGSNYGICSLDCGVLIMAVGTSL